MNVTISGRKIADEDDCDMRRRDGADDHDGGSGGAGLRDSERNAASLQDARKNDPEWRYCTADP
jgi:hypothetical protein